MSLIVEVPVIISWCVSACIKGSTYEDQCERFGLNNEEKGQLRDLLKLLGPKPWKIGNNEQTE